MMKQLLGSTIALVLLAVPVLADDGMEVVSNGESSVVPVLYSAEPTPSAPASNPYALPNVALLSASHADVLQSIDNMRGQLADFGSLALNNGISQTADAFVDHWHLAVETNVATEGESLQNLVTDMVSHNSGLIEDFLLSPPMPTEGSLFSQPSFTDTVAVSPTGGFFAQ